MKMKNLKKMFLDTRSINIYVKLQVSRFNGVARMEVRYKQERIYILNRYVVMIQLSEKQ